MNILKINLLILLAVLVMPGIAIAQDNVGIGTNSPHSKSILDVESTDKGVLIPRMTTAERTSMLLSAPNNDPTAMGMIVYDSDYQGFWYYDGQDWVEMSAGLNTVDSLILSYASFDTVFASFASFDTLLATYASFDTLVVSQAYFDSIFANFGSFDTLYVNGVDIYTLLDSLLQNIDNQDIYNYIDSLVQAVDVSQDIYNILDSLTAGLDSNSWKLNGNTGTSSSTNFLGTTDANALVIKTDNTERIRVLSTGNVGIGTTSPSASMHINSDVGIPALRVQVNGSTRLRVNSDESVVIGNTTSTGPSRGLYIYGKTGMGTSSPDAKLHINSGSGEQSLRVQVNGNTRLRVNSDESVVVGTNDTTGPARGLYVYGDVGIGIDDPEAHLDFEKSSTTTSGWQSRFYYTSSSDQGLLLGVNEHASNDYSAIKGVVSTTSSSGNIAGGLWGYSYGSSGSTGSGVLGTSNNKDGYGIYAQNPATIWSGSGWALYSDGWAGGTTVWSMFSDKRIKRDIEIIPNALEKLQKLNGIEYYYDNTLFPGLNFDEETRQYGFLAQEIESVFPEMVREANISTMLPSDDPAAKSAEVAQYKLKSTSYTYLIPVLVEAVKEQQKIIENLEQRITELEQNK